MTILFIFLFVVQKIVQSVDLSRIRGVGFDATCSLVVLDEKFEPLAVNAEGKSVATSN